MNKSFTPAAAALVTLPLLAVAIALPAGLDVAVSPFVAGGLPLAWAALVIIAARLSPGASAAAFAAALPFSAFALAAFGQRPAVPWLFALAASAAAAVAVRAAGSMRGTANQATADNQVRVATLMMLGAAPGLALARLASPWGGCAVAVLVAAVALLVIERRRR